MPRRELSLTEKVQLIKESSGQSQRKLAEKFGIGKTQVHSILKRKAEILDGYEENRPDDRKRLCKRSPVEEVYLLLWEWFQQARARNIPVSGPMLEEKARHYAAELGIPEGEFKASNGWLDRFRQRYNINFVIHGRKKYAIEKCNIQFECDLDQRILLVQNQNITSQFRNKTSILSINKELR